MELGRSEWNPKLHAVLWRELLIYLGLGTVFGKAVGHRESGGAATGMSVIQGLKGVTHVRGAPVSSRNISLEHSIEHPHICSLYKTHVFFIVTRMHAQSTLLHTHTHTHICSLYKTHGILIVTRRHAQSTLLPRATAPPPPSPFKVMCVIAAEEPGRCCYVEACFCI